MIKNILMPGDQFATKGTTPWADWQRSRMKTALKDVNMEARQIVQIIRDMCQGEQPAWHLMTRPDGIGYRTFEEFVTSADGLAYPDYTKFKVVATSEPAILNLREYELLTTAPSIQGSHYQPTSRTECEKFTRRKTTSLRAIARADPFVRELYVKGLIDAHLAELLGPHEKAPDYAERSKKAEQALKAIRQLERSDHDGDYRQAVNAVVRKVFRKQRRSCLDLLQSTWRKATAVEREAFLTWLEGGQL